MPRVEDRVNVKFHIPGVYAALLQRQCVTSARARLGPLVRDGVSERRPLAEREPVFEERITAGEPLEIPKWYIGGMAPKPSGAPAWLRLAAIDGGVNRVRVYVDDTVERVAGCDAAS